MLIKINTNELVIQKDSVPVQVKTLLITDLNKLSTKLEVGHTAKTISIVGEHKYLYRALFILSQNHDIELM